MPEMQVSKKGNKKKYSKQKLEILLSVKCKELVNANHEIKNLQTLCQELRSEINNWKTKSQNLAKQCSSMASILSIQLGLKTSNLSPSISPAASQKSKSPQASKKRRLTEVFVVKNDKEEPSNDNENKFVKSDHCYSNRTESAKSDKNSSSSHYEESAVSNGSENGFYKEQSNSPAEINSQNKDTSSKSLEDLNPKNGFPKTGAENGINEPNPTKSSNLPEDPKPEISIPELPNMVSISDSSLPKPILTLTKTEKGLEVLWDFETETDESLIKSYELYALNRGNNTKAWKKVGDINAIKLPIKVTLSDFKAGTCYIFAVRAKSKSGELGPYSDHQKIIL